MFEGRNAHIRFLFRDITDEEILLCVVNEENKKKGLQAEFSATALEEDNANVCSGIIVSDEEGIEAKEIMKLLIDYLTNSNSFNPLYSKERFMDICEKYLISPEFANRTKHRSRHLVTGTGKFVIYICVPDITESTMYFYIYHRATLINYNEELLKKGI